MSYEISSFDYACMLAKIFFTRAVKTFTRAPGLLNYIHQDTKSARLIAVYKRTLRFDYKYTTVSYVYIYIYIYIWSEIFRSPTGQNVKPNVAANGGLSYVGFSPLRGLYVTRVSVIKPRRGLKPT